MSKLSRHFISKSGGTHFRDGKAACRHDQRRGCELFLPRLPRWHRANSKRAVVNDFPYERVQKNAHAGGSAFLHQHAQNIGGRPIAKELSAGGLWVWLLLVIRNLVFF